MSAVAVIKPRTKVVFFRVSQEEFDQMEQACFAAGARSVSDFVRMATRRLLSAQHEEGAVSLQEQLKTIDTYLRKLCAIVEKSDLTAGVQAAAVELVGKSSAEH